MVRNETWLGVGLRGPVHEMGWGGNEMSLCDAQVSGLKNLINLLNNVQLLSKKDLTFIGHVRTFLPESTQAGQ